MMYATKSEQESALTGHRFFLLFLLLLGTLILYPYADASRFGYYAFRVIGTAATLISVYAAKIHRTLLVLALILAIPTLLQRILLPKADASSFSVFKIVLSFVFDVLIIVVIFRHVFAKEQANSETIFGAPCIYLLVGFSFASAYGMVATLPILKDALAYLEKILPVSGSSCTNLAVRQSGWSVGLPTEALRFALYSPRGSANQQSSCFAQHR